MKKRLVRNMQNVIFLLLTFTTGLFYFCFYLVSLTLGVSLSFTLIGIPLLTYVMRTTQTFVQYERIQTKIYTDISIEPYEGKQPIDGQLWLQAKAELMDRRNWSAIFWLMQKLVIGLVCLIGTVVLYIMPLILILTPFLAPYINIQILGMPINTLTKSLSVMVIGLALAALGLWIGEGAVRMCGVYTRHMIKAIKGYRV
ncbi:luciferase [Paenibacillus sp. SYP-B3998]|uniref:Luciferase n=1 Tax=Paenibacillus sp. SYP-B3998 TaxID=2678564 RepID=A0A6G3ZU54_9BACL|nr:sensor domain-containing protein [Paenibacillus sp. SYP-B3998]NEW04947.1 luciferase [Paenibacillus sp. SYP-B3998]